MGSEMTQFSGKRNTRALALQVIMQTLEEGKYCDKVLHRTLDENPGLTRQGRAFVTRLSEGTIERCIEIDYILNQFSKVKVKKMKAAIRNILRMAVYQFLYMDQVPNRAACDEAVRLAVKWHLQGLRGFVNGVLRNIDRNMDEISYPEREDFISYASVRYSMPEWIVSYLLEDYAEDTVLDILAAYYDREHSTAVRCNFYLGSPESRTGKPLPAGADGKETALSARRACTARVVEIRTSLEEQGVMVRFGNLLEEALLIRGYDRIDTLAAFRQGLIQVQAESSMLVGRIAGIEPGQTVLDICAAPGGKSVHAADLLQGKGKLLSCDISEDKLHLIQENMERAGVEYYELYQQDARILRPEWIDSVDVLIADLPCSGLGVMGKKCDIKYHNSRESMAELVSLQREILKTASQYVRPGGTMVYSTCTLGRRENQENVNWIKENLPFRPVSVEEQLPARLQGRSGPDGYIQILPTDRSDGFFVSKFRKL